MDVFLYAAAAAAAVTFCVHTLVGGFFVVRPLLANRTLPIAVKWLNYYCWHVTSLTIAFIAVGFLSVAWSGDDRWFVRFLTTLAAAASLLSVGVAAKAGIHPLRFPSTSLFALTALCGLAALII